MNYPDRPYGITSVLVRGRQEGQSQRRRREDEKRGQRTWPEAKEGHHPLELEKAENRFCPRAFRGTQLCSHLILSHFRLLTSRAIR